MHAKNKKILNSLKPVIEIVTSTESMQTFLVIRLVLFNLTKFTQT